MSAQQEFDEAVEVFKAAEKSGDDYIKDLCKAMLKTIKVQDGCACDPDNPVHPIKFAKTKVQIATAIVGAAESLEEFARAHRSGDKACGPVIGPTGGGGGKAAPLMREFYLADAYRIDKQKQTLA